MLTFERANELLRLDPETGRLYWKQSRGRVAIGQEAGTVTALDYIQVRVDGKFYRRARLVWLLHTGSWPVEYIDHINRDTMDDRPKNLRDVSAKENSANRDIEPKSNTGYLGIRLRKGKYEVTKNKIYLGTYSTLERAVHVRESSHV